MASFHDGLDDILISTKAVANEHRDRTDPHWRLYACPAALPEAIQVRGEEYATLDERRLLTPEAYESAEDAHAALAQMAQERRAESGFALAARRAEAIAIIGAPLERDQVLDRYYATLP